jgi:A/G-specific adenine glycosylase
MKTEERITAFVDEIWSWYGRHKRTLPWRDLAIKDDTERAYQVLVSEMMLQQTQVPRVIVIFKRFLDQFPTIKDLAKASNAEVIQAWKGMGYNSRALRLRDAAKTIVEKHQGIFPKEMDELLSIKGIGPYTAAAIRNFAFNIPTPCIDTNIRRILERTFVGDDDGAGVRAGAGDKELLKIAEKVLDRAVLTAHSSELKAAADWHAALMDFGSLVQTKSNPKWEICPLTEKGIMKTSKKSFESRVTSDHHSKLKTRHSHLEPGRMMGSKYIPNRIFRGRIVDALREHSSGLTFEQIGNEICIDWSAEHHAWLLGLLAKLESDRLLILKGKRYSLGS